MNHQKAAGSSDRLVNEPVLWAFSRTELLAGLRRHTGDPKLQIKDIQPYHIPLKRPSIGRIQGIQVTCAGEAGQQTFELVLKEPQGSTRTGTAGVGLREVSVYHFLTELLPVRVPLLVAAHPLGEWMVLDLLPPGQDPQTWKGRDYYAAIDQMIALHDRFWGLGEDLAIFTWLARPLESDFEIYLKAATKGTGQLVRDPHAALRRHDPSLADLLRHLVASAHRIAAHLRREPATLIHGDYWPGNIQLHGRDAMTVYDWQQAGIGPSVLDLVTFVQASRWWFEPLPVPVEGMVSYYRKGLEETTGYTWDEQAWQAMWDRALLWTFLAHWIDLVVAIPDSLMETQYDQFRRVWLEPLHAAADRCLGE